MARPTVVVLDVLYLLRLLFTTAAATAAVGELQHATGGGPAGATHAFLVRVQEARKRSRGFKALNSTTIGRGAVDSDARLLTSPPDASASMVTSIAWGYQP